MMRGCDYIQDKTHRSLNFVIRGVGVAVPSYTGLFLMVGFQQDFI